MTDGHRLFKQFLVVLVFLLILSGIVYGGVVLFRPTQITPTPNPTANLLPLVINFSKLISVQGSDYDFIAKVTNPNTNFGSGDVSYELTFYDNNRQQIFQKTGNFYILPGQTKYLIDTPIKLSQITDQPPNFVIKSVDWQELDSLGSNAINLKSANGPFDRTFRTGSFGRVGGSVFNSSGLDLDKVDISVALYDSSNNVVAAGKTDIRTFLAGTSRGLEVSWFSQLPDDIARADVEVNTNVFENSNFLRRYGGQERFQELF